MRYLIALLLVTLIIQYCKKNNDTPGSYYGSWELRSAEGGLAGYIEYPPANGNIIVITEDSLFEYVNHVLIAKNRFELIKDTLRGYGNDRLADKLLPDPVMGIEGFLERKGNKLILYQGIPAADGVSSIYQRIE